MEVNFDGKIHPLNNSNLCRHFLKLAGSAFFTEIQILKQAYIFFAGNGHLLISRNWVRIRLNLLPEE